MTIGSILLSLALLLIVGLYLARPFLESAAGPRRRQSRYSDLLAAKESILIQMRNLDFDHQTGKVPEENYQLQRAELMAEATAILKSIDELEGAAMSTEPVPETGAVPVQTETDIDANIEAAVLRVRQSHTAAGSLEMEPNLGVEAAPATVTGSGAKFCPQCGKHTDPDDKFCVNCGAKLRDPHPV
jgi:hypothetical protein